MRPSPFAGTWYPGDRRALEEEVARHLDAALTPRAAGRVVALISPHAGLVYSGPVAAWGYKLLAGRHGLSVVLVGPSHRGHFEGVAVYARGAFETPLGTVPVDEELAAGLVNSSPQVVDWGEPHLGEHSLEMQLPFLQYQVPELRIVPALMGSQERSEVDALAEALASALGSRTGPMLLVASSDLSHYLPAPVANALDSEVVEDVTRFDPESLMDRLERRREHACGGGPMVAVMKAARALGARRSQLLRYADSGDAGPGDKDKVVGYLSAALCAT